MCMSKPPHFLPFFERETTVHEIIVSCECGQPVQKQQSILKLPIDSDGRNNFGHAILESLCLCG